MKLRFKQPEEFLFDSQYLVRVDDINYGGHMGNERYLLAAQEIRRQFFESLQFSEHHLGNKDTAIVLANSAINYKAEVFYGETLECKLGLTDIGRSSFDLYYLFIRKEDTKIVAEVLTTVVTVNLMTRKPCSIPHEFLTKIGR